MMCLSHARQPWEVLAEKCMISQNVFHGHESTYVAFMCNMEAPDGASNALFLDIQAANERHGALRGKSS